MEIRRLTRGKELAVEQASACFDERVIPVAATRFLNSDDHHLLVAYVGGAPVGFVTGVEMTHPDKGTEMFLYELGVGADFRGQGIGRALVTALAELAQERGCYGMWVLADHDNDAALATYAATGAIRESENVLLSWSFTPPNPKRN
jgi:ribosomal protein S18 acetylase RimI-like enzyme